MYKPRTRCIATFAVGVAIFCLQSPYGIAALVEFHFQGRVTADRRSGMLLPETDLVGHAVNGVIRYDWTTLPSGVEDEAAYYYLESPSLLAVSVSGIEVSSFGDLSASVTNTDLGDGNRDYSFVMRDGRSSLGVTDQLNSVLDTGDTVLVDGRPFHGILAVGFDAYGTPALGEETRLPRTIGLEDFIFSSGSILLENVAPLDADWERIDFSIDTVLLVPEPSAVSILVIAGILGLVTSEGRQRTRRPQRIPLSTAGRNRP